MHLIFFLLSCVLGFPLTAAAADALLSEDLAAGLLQGGHVLMIRHALAPGSGDPAHFEIGDCTTQRNLDQTGRRQARQIGDWLREHGVASARVYSSQWCRCIQTAELMDLGPVTELPALNSFYQKPQDRQPRLNAVRDFLGAQPTDGALIILVTHFVTIAGITGESVSSGEGVVIQLRGDGDHRLRGRLAFDQ